MCHTALLRHTAQLLESHFYLCGTMRHGTVRQGNTTYVHCKPSLTVEFVRHIIFVLTSISSLVHLQKKRVTGQCPSRHTITTLDQGVALACWLLSLPSLSWERCVYDTSAHCQGYGMYTLWLVSVCVCVYVSLSIHNCVRYTSAVHLNS